jgi:hypothetical protein
MRVTGAKAPAKQLPFNFAYYAAGFGVVFGCPANELAIRTNRGLRTLALAYLFGDSPILSNPSRCSFCGSHQVKWFGHDVQLLDRGMILYLL